ncbi:MAG: tRNA (adenosine(37)-N6)-threonylcarbamoyltransferase complex dimerization subunit type 1 TsaB [Pseudomonadota bacterium]
MPPRILAFDTSGPHIAVAMWPNKTAPTFVEMARGQAERLMTACEDKLAAEDLSFQDLDAVAVGVGPGNFTGIRIGVSAARGLALALGIPAVGVTGFEMLHQGQSWSARVMLALPAPRDQAYVQTFVHGRPINVPSLTTIGEREPALEHPNLLVAGYRADEIATAYNAAWDLDVWTDSDPSMTAATLGLIASNKLNDQSGAWSERPSPLYIKPADAAPSPHQAPTILK